MRYDIGEFRKPERTPQGFLRADAVLTRVGVFTYRNKDGSVRRELRPPEEVFKPDSLRSFAQAPVTNLHPTEAVTADNVTKYSVGVVGERVDHDNRLVRSSVLIMDKASIEEVESDKKRQVSCGYTCDYDPTPGEWDGERYDGIQRNIVGNHVALVTAGRAGPEASIRLDADDAIQIEDTQTPASGQQGSTMKTRIRIDGIDCEVDEQQAQMMQRALEKRDSEIVQLQGTAKSLAADLDKHRARADALEDELKKEKAARADALNPDKVRDLVKSRVALEQQAATILGNDTKLDSLDDSAIKKAVVLHFSPEAKLDGQSDAYVQARFDQAIEQSKAEPETRMDSVRSAVLTTQLSGGSALNIGQVRQDQLEKSRNRWREPLSANKAN